MEGLLQKLSVFNPLVTPSQGVITTDQRSTAPTPVRNAFAFTNFSAPYRTRWPTAHYVR